MTALEAVGITVEAGGRALLRDVSLSLQAGRVLGIIGPNGAGKSTLVKACAGLLAPTAGLVTLLGRPLADWPARERAVRLGYLPQHFLPHWDYSVRELLRLGVERGGTRHAPATVEAAAIAFELQPFLIQRWSNLSGGERGRALAASVLAPAPAVVLADEPAAALDMGQAAALMMRLNAQAAAGAAVAIVVHDLNLAARWCDRLLILAGGQSMAEGPAGEILCSPALDDVFGIRLERLIARDGTVVLIPESTADVGTGCEGG